MESPDDVMFLLIITWIVQAYCNRWYSKAIYALRDEIVELKKREKNRSTQ